MTAFLNRRRSKGRTDQAQSNVAWQTGAGLVRFRAARILAAIDSTRLRPSSTSNFSIFASCSPHGFWARKSHLWSTPVVLPFYRAYEVPWQSSAACKAFKVLKTTVLKRLASAVQLRPWPPYFQSLSVFPSRFLLPFASNSVDHLRRQQA